MPFSHTSSMTVDDSVGVLGGRSTTLVQPEISQLLLNEFAMTFNTHSHGPQRIKVTDSDDSLTFPLVRLSGQIFFFFCPIIQFKLNFGYTLYLALLKILIC